MQKVRKAVFPVAGLGTRVLPATKATPKEMLTVLDRPAIDHVVAEALEGGISHCVMVTGRNKGAIEDYFDRSYELEDSLKMKGKTDILQAVEASNPIPGSISFVRQQSPLGLGHAVWCARDIIGEEPFAVLLPDVLTLGVSHGAPKCLAQSLAARERVGGGNIIAVAPAPWEDIHKYGVVDPAEDLGGGLIKIKGMVEKPSREQAPSNQMILGRYILEPQIFEKLEAQGPGAGGEIQLTDAMDALFAEQPFHANVFDGEVHDIGSFPGWLRANAGFALNDPAMRETYVAILKDELTKAGVKVLADG